MQTKLSETIIAIHGKEGREWLANLSLLLKKLEQQWGFEIDSAFPDLTHHYVLKVRLTSGEPAVLKCGVPNQELSTEIAALTHFSNQTTIKLLKAEPTLGALLLEQAQPGHNLATVHEEDQACAIFSAVMTKLHQTIEKADAFPSVQQWHQGFQRFYDRQQKAKSISHSLIDYADKVGQELLSSMGELVLLHGDLHHHNILSATREPWLVIDPKGIIGEREYEIGAFIRNPLPLFQQKTNPKPVLKRRLDTLSELNHFDRKRLWGWSFYQAVLATLWCLEDTGDDNSPFSYCAERLLEIKDW